MDNYDMTPRYAPNEVIVRVRGGFAKRPVLRWVVHAAGTHPNSPIRNDMMALECVTDSASAWYGVQNAYINSELRMVVVGTNTRDGVRMRWPVAQVAP